MPRINNQLTTHKIFWNRILELAGLLASEKYFSESRGLVRGMEQVTSLIQNHSIYSVFFSHVTADKNGFPLGISLYTFKIIGMPEHASD